MSKLVINGGRQLGGRIRVQGSKNSSLPILAASLLTDERCVIHNCPDISDTRTAIDILRGFGADAERSGDCVSVCTRNMSGRIINPELMQKMRSSVMFTGAVLGRCGEAIICPPGGCRLGERPIDMHISSLTRLGANIEIMGECIACRLKEVCSDDIFLIYPSVGTTENIMLMCAASGREVRIFNPAREPEIVDLQNFLNLMGADIRGAGGDLIKICPSGRLHGCEYTVMPDRIAVSTIACATAACGGDVFIDGAEADHIQLVTAVLKEIGCDVSQDSGGIGIRSTGKPKAVNMIKTLPYPGFPTDAQPLLGAVLTRADGVSKMCETIFDNRFGYLKELEKMGADISVSGSNAEIRGKAEIYGADVAAGDLRGGAALVVAGLAAFGTTAISGLEYIDRGYEKIEDTFKKLGADILRI